MNSYYSVNSPYQIFQQPPPSSSSPSSLITWIIENATACKERLFCSFGFWIAVLLLILFGLFLLNIVARVILSIINCVVTGILNLCDKCCISRMAPVENECTAELIELRDRTLSWGKNAEAKIGALRKDYEELKKRSNKISTTIHWPGV